MTGPGSHPVSPSGAKRIRLVAFDLDGTLLRVENACETLARELGHLDRMRELESLYAERRDRASLRLLREQLVACYGGIPPAALRSYLATCPLAPGAAAGFAVLRRAGIATAIASINWEFAAAWAADQLGADHHVGTRLLDDGAIIDFWPEDKATWLEDLMRRQGVTREEAAAVGDSWRDLPMFGVVGLAIYVGSVLPTGLDAIHLPNAGIDEIARLVVTRSENPSVGRPRRTTDTSTHYTLHAGTRM